MKSFQKIVFFLLLLTCSGRSYSQVNLQIGTPQINLPLFRISDANSQISTSLSLKYIGGNGILVDNVASSVGTGWDIFAGGSILRIQNGEPDDQLQKGSFNYPTAPNAATFSNWTASSPELQNYHNYVSNYYPNGYLFSGFAGFSPSDYISDAASQIPLTKCPTQGHLQPPLFITDRELDVFSFDFNGRTGRFVIGSDSEYPVLLLNEKDSKLKIEPDFDMMLPDQGIRTTLRKFKITDESGIEYFFEEMELNEVIKYEKISVYNIDGTPVLVNGIPYESTLNNSCFMSSSSAVSSTNNSCYKNQMEVSRGVRTGQYVCNKWVLTKIANPLSLKEINFIYEDKESVYEGAIRFQKSNLVLNGQYHCANNTLKELRSSKGKRLKSIQNGTGDKIQLDYGGERVDLPGDQVLSEVHLLKNNTILNTYKFKYGYFLKKEVVPFSHTFSNINNIYARLSLLEVQQVGNGISNPPFKFEYHTSSSTLEQDIVPARFSYLKDHWGRYNMLALSLPSNFQEPAIGNMYSESTLLQGTNALFKDVIQSVPTNANGLIKKITNPSGKTELFEYEQNAAIINGQNVSVGGVHVKSITVNDGNNGETKQEFKYSLENQNLSSLWGYEPPVYTQIKKMYSGFCNPNNNANYGNWAPRNVISSSLGAYSTYSDFIQNANLLFSANPLLIEKILFQVLMSFNNTTTYPANSDITTNSSDPINFGNTFPFSFSRVEVLTSQNNLQIKRDDYEFTSPTEYPLESTANTLPYASSWRYIPFKYGLTKKVTNWDNAGAIKMITENNYVENKQSVVNALYASQKWTATAIWQVCGFNTAYNTGSTQNFIATSGLYYPLIGKIDLLETKEYLYNAAGNYSLNITSFEYNNYYLPNLKTQYNSKGEKIQTIYKYSNDYVLAGPIATLKSKNNITAPVLTETYITKSGVKKLLSGSVTEYGSLANGDVKPVKLHEFRSVAPVNDNTMPAFSPAQLIRDENYYQPASELVYDSEGGLVQTNKLADPKGDFKPMDRSSLIYEKGNPSLILATASNADRGNIAYTSFESPGDINNWGYNESLISKDDWFSGNASFKFDAVVRSVSRQSLLSNMKYKITFWAKNVPGNNYTLLINKNNERSSGVLINNITPLKVYTNPVTGWSLYESIVTGATSVYIHNQNPSNTGAGLPIMIDEVRLYPEGSAMNSATYNIQGLKTSTINANNKIQYFDYDGLGRLRAIRDEQRNIIKTYEYNYKTN